MSVDSVPRGTTSPLQGDATTETALAGGGFGAPLWTIDLAGHGVGFNRAWTDATGLLLEDSLGQGWLGAVNQDDQRQLRLGLAAARVALEPFAFQIRLLEGEPPGRWFVGHGVPHRDPNGQCDGFVLSCVSVSGQSDPTWTTPPRRPIHAEGAPGLVEDEVSYRHLFLHAVDGILIGDPKGSLIGVNPAAAALTGMSIEDLLGRNIRELFPPTELERTPLRYDVLDRHKSIIRERRLLRKDGSTIPIEMHSRQLPDGRYQAFLRDVSGRYKVEEELSRSTAALEVAESSLQAALAQSPAGIMTGEAPDGRIRLINRAAEEILGVTRELQHESIATGNVSRLPSLYRVDGTQLRPRELPLRAAIQDGTAFQNLELRVLRTDGTERWVLLNGAPIRDAAGAIVSGIVVFYDITERRQIELAMRQSQKLESLGVLAGGIAHDFNNLLTAVLGNVNLAQVELPADSPVVTYVGAIEAIVLKAADLTKQLLAYSGRSKLSFKARDLNLLVTEMLDLLRVTVPKKISIDTQLHPGLPRISADGSQLQQVVMNLITNAADAIGDQRGAIRVSTRAEQLRGERISSHDLGGALPTGLYVVLEVSDTGCGMSQAILERIFDPFFTTKSLGRGLGLSAMQGILRGHRAGIRIDSEVGKGTTFRIYFPASVDVQEAEAELATPSQSPLSGTVLLVDDEPPVRMTVDAALRSMGFDVITATDGQEAVELFERHAGSIDLVLMDLTMPRMNGKEAATVIRRLRPNVPVLLTSGYLRSDTLAAEFDLDHTGFIQKPFSLAELRRSLQGLLRDATTRGGPR